MVLLFGCTRNYPVAPPVPSQGQNQLEQTQQKNEQFEKACGNLYAIYQAAYNAGIGRDTDFCITLAQTVFEKNPLQVDSTENLKISKFCGMTCVQGSQGKNMIPYNEFREIFRQTFGG